jgi:hypothetical protein
MPETSWFADLSRRLTSITPAEAEALEGRFQALGGSENDAACKVMRYLGALDKRTAPFHLHNLQEEAEFLARWHQARGQAAVATIYFRQARQLKRAQLSPASRTRLSVDNPVDAVGDLAALLSKPREHRRPVKEAIQ